MKTLINQLKISKNRLRKKMNKYIHKSKKILLYLALLTSTKNITLYLSSPVSIKH